jgi:hypothetical protein
MPTLTAAHTIDKAELILQDTTNIRWSEAELLGWFNDGQREIVMLRPDTYVQTTSLAMVAGTRQSIPANGYQLVKVTRNMGANGTTPGRVVRKVPEEQLDASMPNWHAATAAAETLHYTFDPRQPRAFYVYPPAIANNTVELVYSAAPPPLAAKTDVQLLDDVYANPLLDYVLYRAYSKDAESTSNAQRALAHRQAFDQSLGLKAAADGASVAADEVRG